MNGQQPTPGWYPDPQNPRQTRWWDGTAWTANTQGSGSYPTPIPDSPKSPSLLKNPWFFTTLAFGITAVVLAITMVVSQAGATDPTKPPSSGANTSTPDAVPTDPSTVLIDPDTGEPVERVLPATPPRDNASAVETTLAPGEYVVGTDIQPGRYRVTAPNLSASAYGVLFSGTRDDNSFYSWSQETIGGRWGDPSFTVDLASGDRLTIDDTEGELLFQPVATTESMTLTSGYWVVGLDIPAGLYRVSRTTGDPDLSGTIEILVGLHPDYADVDSWFLGDTVKDRQVVGVLLSEGEVIKITQLDGVVFY